MCNSKRRHNPTICGVKKVPQEHLHKVETPSQQQVYSRIFRPNSTFPTWLQDELDCFQSCKRILKTWWWLRYADFRSLCILGLLFITINNIFWCSARHYVRDCGRAQQIGRRLRVGDGFSIVTGIDRRLGLRLHLSTT